MYVLRKAQKVGRKIPKVFTDRQNFNRIYLFLPHFNFAIFSKKTPLLSTSSFWVWAGGTIYNTHTLKPFKEFGLDSQRVKKLASKLYVHFVNFAAKLVHTKRALSSTVVDSHQEPVLGQACNPPDLH